MPKKIRVIDAKAPDAIKMKRVAAYARVSMETERLHHSLSAQVSHYSALIQKTPGWEYAGVFADDGLTGTKANRPEFQRMLAECEAGRIDIILSKSISRFARNTVDLLETVRHLKEIGVEVRFEKEGISTFSEDGELMLTLLASFAQEESRSISENSKWGIRKLYERGKPRLCKVYGYRVKNGKYVIKEDEAEVVRRIFQLFLEGDSCYIIAKKIEAEGAISYAGKRLCGAVIASMVRQEKYTGCTLCQKQFIADPISHKEFQNKGQLPMYFVEGTHPAIISMETFEAAQKEFAARYGVEIVNGIAQKASYFFHKDKKGISHPPHRKPQWSEEQRKSHGEYFRTRDCGICRYDFSHFIECENCGGHLQASLRHYVDGTSEVKWMDVEHTGRAKTAPRPVIPSDSVLKAQLTAFLGWEEFDAGKMFEILEIISINVDIITLHYKDGHTESFKYIKPKEIHRKRKETE